jgi:3-isopropylmalate/(R)-2-methylmalate dehydratase small subunit
MKSFDGSALFLDQSNISTDAIIPAKCLAAITRNALAPFLLEGLVLNGFGPAADIAGRRVIVTRGRLRLRRLPGTCPLGAGAQWPPPAVG